ncbi:MAG: alpha/beta hydrolase [Gammaproteobacteria bacterium]
METTGALKARKHRDARGVPWLDFGGRGPELHFAHANGFPPGAYRSLLERLANGHRVFAVGHRPLWSRGRPESELRHWDRIADDLIAFLEGSGRAPVVAAGHSLGATASMFAAVRRPELFQALVLIDPVFLEPATALLFNAAPRFARDRVPIVRSAMRRRRRFADAAEAFAYYRPKKVFAGLTDQALADYVAHALEPDGNGVRLAYSPEWEAQVYRLAPYVWRRLGRVEVPTLGIRGAHSDTLSAAGLHRWRKIQPKAELHEIPGAGHLVPLEAADAVAALVTSFTARLPG